MNFLSAILVAFLAIVATPQQSKPDVKGSSDHPLFPNRMPGYTISSYEKLDFKSHSFPTLPAQIIDGKYTSISYHLQDPSKNPGKLTIRRFYENAVKSVGGQVLPLDDTYLRESRITMKVIRNGVEVWVELNMRKEPDYVLNIIERAPMEQLIKADATATALDVNGSADYPLLPNRMPGYTISSYEKLDFKSHSFPTLPAQIIDGKYTSISYHLQDPSKNPGKLTIRRFYENAVKSVGGQVLPLDDTYLRESRITMKVIRNGVEVWVELNMRKEPDYVLNIIERAPMQQVITADAMAAVIDKDGFVPLDIHFATGKAEILPKSRPIINEIVSLLKKRPNLRIGVEGHTDNTGNPAANKTLSNARAKAIAEAIAAAGISSNRLDPVGHGQERPIADNRTEEGRAKNRRVELVKR